MDNQSQTINFPEQLTSPYSQINDLLDAANRLIKYLRDGQVFDRDKIPLLITLIHLERIIDYYRGFIPPGSGAAFPEDKKLVDTNLESLRKEIWNIRANVNDEEFKKAIESEGEEFKLRFKSI